ncbi:putative anion transporter 4, chloroplastic [Dendrobium catenatum]|uniref:Putative anion transporter 4, chloroplastic n=1 Tax=Dendrobium catenatum TaxID=906689 RepID=A0A2I0VZN5_9ASPA|nr:putative anion transporter 4, chloroplastic [Dendrobium catenatum]
MSLLQHSVDRVSCHPFTSISREPSRRAASSSISGNGLPPRFSQLSVGRRTSQGPLQWVFPKSEIRRIVQRGISRNSASGSFLPENELQSPTLLEFVTSERVKVVAMLGLALALCNADRVVMSVAIVPLSKARGWSQSFSGIVQLAAGKFLQNVKFKKCYGTMEAMQQERNQRQETKETENQRLNNQ